MSPEKPRINRSFNDPPLAVGGAAEGDGLLATHADQAAVIRRGGFIFPRLFWHFVGRIDLYLQGDEIISLELQRSSGILGGNPRCLANAAVFLVFFFSS